MDVMLRKVLSMKIILRYSRNIHYSKCLFSTDLNGLQLRSKKLASELVSRKIHRCCALNQQNKLTPEESDSTENEKSVSMIKDSEIKPEVSAKEVTVKERRKIIVPPLSEPEEEKEMLPNHDPGRITSESRLLVQKASSMFDDLALQRGATKEVFKLAVHKYISKETLYRRGAVEFIYAGLHEMKRFGVARDLECYKALIQAFPESKMIPRNPWQVEFMHYPRQQQCGIDLLEMMEQHGVIPDRDFGRLLRNRFGNEAHVTRKYRRIIYWLPKFKNMNPYPVPFNLPVDPIELALLALKRMAVDRETEYKVWKTADIMEEPDEHTFIASCQSPTQRRLLQEHETESPLFVEGPFHVFMRHIRQSYFLLRAEPNINALMKQKQLQKEEEKDDNLFEWKNFFEEENYSELYPVLSVHEQDDSTVMALCITGTSSKSSVVNWVRCLEHTNPNLGKTPILFQLISSSENELQTIGDNREFRDKDGS